MKTEVLESATDIKTRFTLPKETKLDRKALELIAVGVSLGVNCKECLEYHARAAMKSGADEREIAEAVKVGMMVRAGAASIMDRLVVEKAAKAGCDQFSEQSAEGCGCS